MDGLEAVFELIGFIFECVVGVFEGISSFIESSRIIDILTSLKDNPDDIVDAIIDLSDLGGSESQNQENEDQNRNSR